MDFTHNDNISYAMLYAALIYHSYMTIRRYEFSPVTEVISVGFDSSCTYYIYSKYGDINDQSNSY